MKSLEEDAITVIIVKQNIKYWICENKVFSTLCNYSSYFLPYNGKGDGCRKLIFRASSRGTLHCLQWYKALSQSQNTDKHIYSVGFLYSKQLNDEAKSHHSYKEGNIWCLAYWDGEHPSFFSSRFHKFRN